MREEARETEEEIRTAYERCVDEVRECGVEVSLHQADVSDEDDVARMFAGASDAIEFGMLQSIGEGVELLLRSDHEIDLAALFGHWGHGTVIRGWLVELMANALREGGVGPASDVPPDLDALSTYVEDTGEVKWVLEWAQQNDVPVPVVSAAQQALMTSRDRDWPALKAVALLRNQFGGACAPSPGRGGAERRPRWMSRRRRRGGGPSSCRARRPPPARTGSGMTGSADSGDGERHGGARLPTPARPRDRVARPRLREAGSTG